MICPSAPTTGSTSRVTPVFRVSNFVGVVGVTTTGTVVAIGKPVIGLTAAVPLLATLGICGGVKVVGYRNSLIISIMARCPLLVVTFGAERRSTPFFWLRA